MTPEDPSKNPQGLSKDPRGIPREQSEADVENLNENHKPVLARNGKRVFFGTAFSPIMRENQKVQGPWRELQTPVKNIKNQKQVAPKTIYGSP